MSLLSFIGTINNRLNSFKIDVTKVISPEVLESNGDITEVVLIETGINVLDSLVESRKNPFVNEKKRIIIELSLVREVSRNAHETELSTLPDLVAEFSVTNNLLNIEVDRSRLLHVSE